MRAVVQRVSRATVSVENEPAGAIEAGLLVLLGVGVDDTEAESAALAAKVAKLRIFEDDAGKMNRSCAEAAGAVLCISQFTLFGDIRRGNRPSFEGAAAPDLARRLYEHFCGQIEEAGLHCERGVFGAHMVVELVNDGPVTLMVDTADLARPRR